MNAASTVLTAYAVEPTMYERYLEKQTWSTSPAAPDTTNRLTTAGKGTPSDRSTPVETRPTSSASARVVSARSAIGRGTIAELSAGALETMVRDLKTSVPIV